MMKREKSGIMLEVLSEQAPCNVNWNFEELYINAIMAGFTEIEKYEQNEIANKTERKVIENITFMKIEKYIIGFLCVGIVNMIPGEWEGGLIGRIILSIMVFMFFVLMVRTAELDCG